MNLRLESVDKKRHPFAARPRVNNFIKTEETFNAPRGTPKLFFTLLGAFYQQIKISLYWHITIFVTIMVGSVVFCVMNICKIVKVKSFFKKFAFGHGIFSFRSQFFYDAAVAA